MTSAESIITEPGETNRLFPVFLKLENMQLLIIGGGKDALEALHAVLQNAPATEITLVALTISKEIETLASLYPNITLEERSYDPEVLDEGEVVIIAINNQHLSKKIYQEAKEKGKWLNVTDMPDLSDFYLGSVVHKGNLKLAISTNGKSASIAKRLNETLDDALPAELDDVLNNMQIIRSRLNGNFQQKVTRLNNITKVLVAENEKVRKWKNVATWSLVIFASMLLGHFIFTYLPLQDIGKFAVDSYNQLDGNFPLLILAGFVAQLVDGALGMGYGLTSTTILLSAGVNAAAISGSVHTAEMFASGASGYSHYKFGNVNKKMFKKLVIPGVVGAILGAILLVYFGDSQAKYIRPILATYTMILGIKFIYNAFKPKLVNKKFKQYSALAGAGGFLDSFGGGGWGPIVTSTLINVGRSPKYVIGTVSLTEFFVTLASAFSFFLMIGVTHWQVILGLIVGGLLAAPLAAKLAGKMPRKTAYLLLGVLVIIWSLRIIVKSF
ncbi:MAG: TSUP family transporter [Bacteroidota bacterium]